MVEVAKSLEKQNLGSFIVGRNGDPDRFEWHYSLKAIGQAGIEGKDIVIAPIQTATKVSSPKRKRSTRAETHTNESTDNTNKSSVLILLRDNLELTLPSDITKNEANLIKRALDKLVA